MRNLSGQTLGQYQLRELLGVGGMGAVYRADQAALRRAVAVKVMSSELISDAGYVERFYREARIAAHLEHSHIIPVYDYGVQGEVSYLVMRLLTGGSLRDRLDQRVGTKQALPSLPEVAGLLNQLASALDYAHSLGVIHRDIKPNNVMFDNQGDAYLVDFGIAKLLEATSAITASGAVMGTPLFMSPEQWRSEETTPAADQYALAVMIYLLLTGRAPFEATTPHSLMYKHLNEMPTPPQVYRAAVPEAVTTVLKRALAKEPARRFPTVTVFAQSFSGATTGDSSERTNFFSAPVRRTRPASLTTVTTAIGDGPDIPSARPIHKRPPTWLFAIIGVVLVVSLLGILLSSVRQVPNNPLVSDHTADVLATGTSVVMARTTLFGTTKTLTVTPASTATATPIPSSGALSATASPGVSSETLTRLAVTATTSHEEPTGVSNPTTSPDLQPTPGAMAARTGTTLVVTSSPHTNASPTSTLTSTIAATPTPSVPPTVIPAPTATLTSTSAPTVPPPPTQIAPLAPTSALQPVTANAQWKPVVRAFDGVEMALAPPGCFMMGSDNAYDNEKPGTQICFDKPFWIDKYDVTTAQFKRFNGKAGRDSHWTGDNRPRERVTWFEARDFCALRKAQLPTEAEWEYAARGPDDLAYPWGTNWDASNAVYSGNSESQTADVGSKPGGVSWVGALDMSGNVWQWTNSIYRPYPYNKDDGRESNIDTDSSRVLRGGSWYLDTDILRAANRYSDIPNTAGGDIGFRCARPYD